MTITEVAYCTRPMVQRALKIADTPRLNTRVDNAIMAGARDLEGLLHRRFYPTTDTRSFDLPEDSDLYLFQHELAAAPTEVVSGGDTMTVGADVLPRPTGGPPFTWLEAVFGGEVYWQTQGTEQNAISITGDFGYPTDLIPLCELAATVDSSSFLIMVTDSSQAAPGALLLADAERMIVSDARLADTTVTLAADLGDKKSDTVLTVSDGDLLFEGELLFIAGERLEVQSVAGDTVVVERAVNASTLATHASGSAIYAPRALTVLRGQLGTDIEPHSAGTELFWIKPPSLVTELNVALAINNTQQALAAYTRQVGSGENQREQAGRGVQEIFEDAYIRYGRKARGRAI